jgi:hypothetical protein
VSGFDFVIIIVLLSMAKGTIHKYLDYRIRMADRQVGSGDRNLLRMVEEVRAEMAALKQRETDAILSFDSTLHTLDARLKHLERAALETGSPERPLLSAAGARSAAEPAHTEVTAGAMQGVGSSKPGGR